MINVSILRNGVRMPVVPIDSADANKTGVVVYNPTTKLFSIGDEVITIEDLIITGDIEVEGAAMFRDDVSISGDLFVDGQEHINDSETVQTTGDYFILRHNNGTPLATGENAGLAVFNYALNKTATLTVDKDGTWRIADNTASSTVYNNLYYFDGHYYNTSFVEQTFTDQIKTAFDEDEIANCVLYSNAFYHFDNTNWFAVTLVDNHLVTDATEITDATLIAALNALTKNDLQYFRRLQITTIVEVENQPILTRDEATNLDDAALLKWDATNTRAVGVDLPTQNNQVLTAEIDNTDPQNPVIDYTWKTGGSGSVSRFATMALAQAALAIPEGQDGYIPNNGIVIVDELDAYIKGDEQ